MKKKETSIIHYRKNNQETTKKITVFNKNRISKRILSTSLISENIYYSHNFKLHPDIEILHFKNMIFAYKGRIDFNLHENQILILENCTFNGYKLDIHGGNIEILNPKFCPTRRYDDCYEIKTTNAKDLKIVLDKNTSREIALNLNIETENLLLDGNHQSCIQQIHLRHAEFATFRNLSCNLEELFLESNKEINFENKNYIATEGIFQSYIETGKLNLKNTIIDGKDSNWTCKISITCDELSGEEYQLIADEIRINDDIYMNKSEKVRLTPENLKEESQLESRRKLISLLKGIQQKYSKSYEFYGESIKNQVLDNLENKSIQENSKITSSTFKSKTKTRKK